MKKASILSAIAFLVLVAVFSHMAVSCAEQSPSNTSSLSTDTVFFGSYEQDNNFENGQEPIEWYIIDQTDTSFLLLSKYVLYAQQYNEKKVNTIWLSSSIRKELNDSFLQNAFTELEKSIIQLTSNDNNNTGDPEWDTIDKSTTEDQVFLLTYMDECQITSLRNANIRKAQATIYAKKNGGNSEWWLRSPGKFQHDATFIDKDGIHGTKEVIAKIGIRPAIWIDKRIERAFFPFELFMQAQELTASSNFKEAADIYESLGPYNNSIELSKEARYNQALQAISLGDYSEALNLFLALENFKDSYDKSRECRYKLASNAQKDKNYTEAIKQYEALGVYLDSINQLKSCYKEAGINVYYFTSDPVDTDLNTGYSKKEPIDSNNLHYGWRLGEFFMSKYTSIVNEKSEQPIFIKTLNDSITLWFDLKQDINALNGKNMQIAEDIDGSDQQFELEKQNFGRGILIVRHTDYQNHRNEPIKYTDYLSAKASSGAMTQIEIKEEGDYKVALDYEINQGRIWKNYRIYFTFSVRNGNCMVYPFDVLTDSELSNVATTPNGFYLDLARSRYLDINVKRSIIINGKEDIRFNRSAKDGARFTEEGIYTITVSNRYTGETTTKTIFVGTDKLLQQYINDGFSKDRLN